MRLRKLETSARSRHIPLVVVGACLMASLAFSVPLGGILGGNPREPGLRLKVDDGHAYVGVTPMDRSLSYTVEESEELGDWTPAEVAGDESAPPPIPPLEVVRETKQAAGGSPYGVVPVPRAAGSESRFYRVRVEEE